MIDVLFASYAKDGLFYYSYEYFRFLNDHNIKSRLIIFLREKDTKEICLNILKSKYINVDDHNIIFISQFSKLNSFNNTILIMGKSQIHHAFNMCHSTLYSPIFKYNLKNALNNNLIIIHNENYDNFNEEVKYFKPQKLTHLNDKNIYPNFEGIQYRKKIYFDIYKKPLKEESKTLFNGSNNQYYEDVLTVIHKYNKPIIVVDKFKNDQYKKNQILLPVENILEKFDKYVYTKSFFDPAPRFIQECFYFGKEVIYDRNLEIKDGGSVYYELGLKGENFNLTDEIISIIKNNQ